MPTNIILLQNGYNFLKRIVYPSKETCNYIKITRRHQSDSQLERYHHPEEKIIRVSLIGAPNTGKSTLINALIGRKVCAASNKVHTTTGIARAIVIEGNTQIVFLDTPGAVTDSETKRYNINTGMKVAPKLSISQADVIGVVHDVSNKWLRNNLNPTIRSLLMDYTHIPSFLILNKVDLLKSKRFLFDLVHRLCNGKISGELIERRLGPKKIDVNEKYGFGNFSDVFMISALERDGIDKIQSYLIKNAKPGKWLFSDKDWTDRKPEHVIVETVRAKFLDFLSQELPYELVTEMEFFEETPQKIVALVVVNCTSDRKMKLIAGGAGGRLNQITDMARLDLVDAFKKHVSLNITLRVDKNLNNK